MSYGLSFDISGAVMSVYDPDDFLLVQHDAFGESDSGVEAYETHHPLGFMARPLDPVVDGNGVPDAANTCNLLTMMEAGQGHHLALEDPRTIKKLPRLKQGESMQYGAQGQFLRMKSDGSIVQFTTDKGDADKGTGISWMLQPTGLAHEGPWGRLTYDGTGFRVATTSGASMSLGPASGAPWPLDKFSSRFRVCANMIHLDASAVSIGPTGGPQFPVAWATPLITSVLAPIAVALQAIGAALATAVPSSGMTAAQTAAAQAAVQAATAAIAGAPAAISSSVALG